MLLSPHRYGYDATALLLVIWLVLFESRSTPTRAITAVFAMPLVPLTTLLRPPWAPASAIALVLLLGAMAWEARWFAEPAVFRRLSTKVRQFN